MNFFNMDYFLRTPREQNAKKKKFIFGVFWCGIMIIHNRKTCP
jgi:hypothetical protein